MADWQDAFPSRFLRASDIHATYEAVIQAVDYEDVGTEDNKPEQKLVATFKNEEHRPIVLNVSRCESLTEITRTRDYTKWPGTRVSVSQGVTRFGGKRVPCIVLSAPAGAGTAPKRAPRMSSPEPDDPMPGTEVSGEEPF